MIVYEKTRYKMYKIAMPYSIGGTSDQGKRAFTPDGPGGNVLFLPSYACYAVMRPCPL